MRDGIADGDAGAQRESMAMQERSLERADFRRNACGPVMISFFIE